MADLEQRVATLEREVSALKSRVGVNEEDITSIPDLIKLEFRLGNSQLGRLSRDVTGLQREFAGMRRDLTEMRSSVDALPRAVAELVAEMLVERDKRR